MRQEHKTLNDILFCSAEQHGTLLKNFRKSLNYSHSLAKSARGLYFVPLIANNIRSIENKPQIGNYEEGIIMMMYDEVIIIHEKDLARKRLKH